MDYNNLRWKEYSHWKIEKIERSTIACDGILKKEWIDNV